jgi:glycosyltransferase involved in cell wall biosynthesis
MAPLLSMTVANYNYASSCRRNIESMGETFGDFELILIDNASTDDSVDVLRKFAAADPRIRVVTHGEKGGMIVSLRQSAELSRRTYRVPVDADDWIFVTPSIRR